MNSVTLSPSCKHIISHQVLLMCSTLMVYVLMIVVTTFRGLKLSFNQHPLGFTSYASIRAATQEATKKTLELRQTLEHTVDLRFRLHFTSDVRQELCTGFCCFTSSSSVWSEENKPWTAEMVQSLNHRALRSFTLCWLWLFNHVISCFEEFSAWKTTLSCIQATAADPAVRFCHENVFWLQLLVMKKSKSVKIVEMPKCKQWTFRDKSKLKSKLSDYHIVKSESLKNPTSWYNQSDSISYRSVTRSHLHKILKSAGIRSAQRVNVCVSVPPQENKI